MTALGDALVGVMEVLLRVMGAEDGVESACRVVGLVSSRALVGTLRVVLERPRSVCLGILSMSGSA